MTIYEHDVPFPGEFIQEELDSRGWTQRDLAYVLDTDETAVNRLIKGKVGISPDMAKALAVAFDVDEDFFANLQKAYDIAHAKVPDPAIERRARLQSVFPVREMIRRGWLQDVEASLMNAQLARFFRASNDNVLEFRNAAKKTNFAEEASPAQLAWLYRVRQIAEVIKLDVSYSQAKLIDGMHRLRALMKDPEEIRHVPKLLEECGVRFVLVEGLPAGKIDGVCLWLDRKSPVIGMSLRFDRIDNFWFVLRHECEHVVREHGRDQEVIDVRLEDDAITEEEKQANKAAAEFCVPQEKIANFIVRKSPLFSERDIVNFATVVGVHPGIVIGQLQKKTGRWELLKKLQVKVRHIVTRTAMVDGWGHVAPVQI